MPEGALFLSGKGSFSVIYKKCCSNTDIYKGFFFLKLLANDISLISAAADWLHVLIEAHFLNKPVHYLLLMNRNIHTWIKIQEPSEFQCMYGQYNKYSQVLGGSAI